jgi:6-pyruvoyltetrahydropterin/6-carboxytetrahydropterin synthase
MRFRLFAEFPATHRIRIDTRGTLEPLHAHNWRVFAWLEADDGEPLATARALIGDWVARHDGNCFNEIAPFDRVNPTAEEVARVVYELLRDRVPGARVVRVEIGEAAGFSATYWPEGPDSTEPDPSSPAG